MRFRGATAVAANYYQVLNVSPGASMEEIRASFKQLVLESHPDKNPGRRDWSERRIRELIEAYEIIGDPQARAEFDRRFKHMPSGMDKERPFFFRKKDPQARAMLVLHFLLNNEPSAALALLEEMERRLGGQFLRTNLDRADYLDCLFLLSEYHTTRREYVSAAKRLRSFYLHDRSARYRRHYFDEVVRRLKDLYLRKLPRVAEEDEALQALENAADLGLTAPENLLRLCRLAEVRIRFGRVREAERALARVKSLSPDSAATRKLESAVLAMRRSK